MWRWSMVINVVVEGSGEKMSPGLVPFSVSWQLPIDKGVRLRLSFEQKETDPEQRDRSEQSVQRWQLNLFCR